jgi:hypothetical protein
MLPRQILIRQVGSRCDLREGRRLGLELGCFGCCSRSFSLGGLLCLHIQVVSKRRFVQHSSLA